MDDNVIGKLVATLPTGKSAAANIAKVVVVVGHGGFGDVLGYRQVMMVILRQF